MSFSWAGLGLVTAGIISFLILRYVIDNDKVRARWKWPAGIIDFLGNVALGLLILMFFIASGAEETMGRAGWIPQTRQADIWAAVGEWPIGEIKRCFARQSSSNIEIRGFDCNEKPSAKQIFGEPEPHLFRVELWGDVIESPEQIGIWSCERKTSSFECRFQQYASSAEPVY